MNEQSRMKGNDVERLRKKREEHWVQESTWYVSTYELPSTLEDRRKGIGSGEIRTLDHLEISMFREQGTG